MRAHPESPQRRNTVRSVFAFNPGDLVDVRITDLVYGGAGVGRVDGFVLLVRRALPGDFVRVRITARKPNLAEAVIIERFETSPLAVSARCVYFAECGGCQWMHLAYEQQLDVKERQVGEALERIGGLSGFRLRQIVRSPDIYRYRNKLDLAFSNGPAGLRLGFHRVDVESDVVDIPVCLIGTERMDQVSAAVREFFATRGYTAAPPNGRPAEAEDGDASAPDPGGPGVGKAVRAPEGGKAELRQLVLREGRRTGQMLVNVITGPGRLDDARHLVAVLTDRFPFIVGIVRTVTGTVRPPGGGREYLLFGKASFRETLGALGYEVATSAFFQVNTDQAEALYGRVLELAGLRGRERCLDLYSGVGGLTLFLAARARRVTAVEGAPAAVRCAVANAESNGATNVRVIQGEARRVVARMAETGKSTDLVTVNPPRSGVHADMLATIPRLEPRRIIYVSCNPTTLARDLAGLVQRGYRLTDVEPFDMFPHSSHIETIARLEREV